VTQKPAEVRMGKGKGSVELWVARVKPGRVMFEIDGVPEQLASEAILRGAAKLPLQTRFIKRLQAVEEVAS
jgi:large subunit ribosomal protein L16